MPQLAFALRRQRGGVPTALREAGRLGDLDEEEADRFIDQLTRLITYMRREPGR